MSLLSLGRFTFSWGPSAIPSGVACIKKAKGDRKARAGDPDVRDSITRSPWGVSPQGLFGWVPGAWAASCSVSVFFLGYVVLDYGLSLLQKKHRLINELEMSGELVRQLTLGEKAFVGILDSNFLSAYEKRCLKVRIRMNR